MAEMSERQRRAMDEALTWLDEQDGLTRKAPGWYPHADMADTVHYWDGDAWTDHIAPAGTKAESSAPSPKVRSTATRPCPYCSSDIAATATRCPHCSGELRHCPRCKMNVGTTSHQKFVGVVRGGMKAQHRCMRCQKVLDGPRL